MVYHLPIYITLELFLIGRKTRQANLKLCKPRNLIFMNRDKRTGYKPTLCSNVDPTSKSTNSESLIDQIGMNERSIQRPENLNQKNFESLKTKKCETNNSYIQDYRIYRISWEAGFNHTKFSTYIIYLHITLELNCSI